MVASLYRFDESCHSSGLSDPSIMQANPSDSFETTSSTYQASHDAESGMAFIPGNHSHELKFSYIAGTIHHESRNRFERQLFRSSRGNCYIRFRDIDQSIVDPVTGNLTKKLVFIVFYKSLAIETKIKKIMDAFSAKVYPLPDMDNPTVLARVMDTNYGDINDSYTTLARNMDSRLQLCNELTAHLEFWSWSILREKSVFHALNLFKPDVRGILRGEGWVPVSKIVAAQAVVRQAHRSMDTNMPSYVDILHKPWPTPPTHFELNDFKWPFQEFVNTYGVPRYKEANPALFTAATFPFLYGVMYGDIGHGSILLGAGLFLIFSYSRMAEGRRDISEATSTMYMARWMIVLMGFFSVYCGLIYNDYFALGLDLFGSRWTFVPNGKSFVGQPTCDLQDGGSCTVYPFGIDPAWHRAENDLLFMNSMKMKMSIILGIIQMTVGISLKGINARFFKNKLDFLFEFIPMIIFDLCLFGYMVFLIILKWAINWDARMESATCFADFAAGTICTASDASCFTPSGTSCSSSSTTTDMCPLNYGGTGGGCQPPNLITTLINIILQIGNVDEPMFFGQGTVQTILLFVGVGCIPVLLFGKPLMLYRAHETMSKSSRRTHSSSQSFSSGHALIGHDPILGETFSYDKLENNVNLDEPEPEEDFSEVVIHQGIETIEFVLGMVSNTASYLRLWALSLAHTELATVFWEKTMLISIETRNPIYIFIGFIVFWSVTCGVLLCMDVLECFLHALRLHWVEFQSKFYKADGIPFKPYSISDIIKASSALS